MPAKTKVAILAVAMIAAAGGITACGGSTNSGGSTAGNHAASGSGQNSTGSGTAAGGSSNGVLTVALNGNPTTTDPYDTQDNLSYTIEKTMYQGLLGFDKNMKIVPVLAQSYTVAPDAKSITFTLRQGIKFADGTPFNAEAVKVNLDRAKDPNSHLKRYSLFSMISQVKVLGDYKVEVDLNQPFGAIAGNFAHPAAMMISPKALQEYGSKVAQHPDGTGPYEFVYWKDGSDLLVKQNPNYWGTKTNVKEIDFKFVPDEATSVSMLESGEAQFVFPIPTDQVSSLQSNSDIVVKHTPSIVVDYIAFNTTVKPFNNPLVRQAINYAIDKNGFVQVVDNGFAQPATSAIAPNTWGYAKQPPYDANIQKAKDLLKQAGYPNGFTATLVSSNASGTVKADQFIQQQLQQVGITVNIQPLDSATLDSEIFVPASQSKLQMYFGGWSPSTGDADWGLRPLLTKADFPPTGYNLGFYTDPVVEQAIQAGLDTADPTKRQQAYATAQAQIWKDAPWAFLVVPDNVFAYRSNLQGAYVMPDSTLSLNNASFTN
ncbi:MAG: glutathione ABC transporter substrate-binding protein GsiB [Alicyclobacillus sp.]|nr:glutathione ABC transporter substrate-binding protein GsiB [Alicyclobacillus sp.]